MTRHCDKSVAEKPDNDQWARLQNAVADMSASHPNLKFDA